MSEAVNLTKRLYVTAAGETLEMSLFFDEDGDDCFPDQAVSAVAGPDKFGLWYAIDLKAFEKATVH